ncbi:MAG: hypothetical protein PHU21_05735 [Elusimicrobia bacterium]|jgi:hypothetical protein|nr:hypothetical protein [Elusimicrobiota bacterium]
MKTILALACLALWTLPGAAAAADPQLPADDAQLYQAMSQDRTVGLFFKEKKDALGEYKPENAAQWKTVLDGYREHAKGVDLSKSKTATNEAVRKVGDACDNGQVFDGSKCVDAVPAVPGKTRTSKDGKVKDPKPGEAAAGENIDTDKKAKANLTVGGAPPHGDPPAAPVKPEDPNKWNSTIAGGKMALWAALIGFVFGGPIGALAFGMVGFGAGYFMHKMG